LRDHDWREPICFALGHLYAKSENNPEVQIEIRNFSLKGKSISDVIERHDDFGFDTKDAAYEYVKETVTKVGRMLFSD
jgi:hypothetical protein